MPTLRSARPTGDTSACRAFLTASSSAKSACATACRASAPSCRPSARRSGSAPRYAAGQREIEVGSFVPARLLPQLADTAELVAYAKTLPGLVVSVLVPNLNGAERAIDGRRRPDARAAVGEPRAQPRQPEQDARRGGRRGRPHPRRARRRRVEDADRRRRRHGLRLHDPGRGRRRARCCACMQALLDAGADRVSIADTVGYAGPGAVRDLFEQARADRRRPLLVRPLPRHARPGAGQRLRRAREPASTASTPRLAGIGGCPHAPGASGNVAERRPRLHARAAWASPPASTSTRLLALRAERRRLARGRDAARHALARRPAEDLRRREAVAAHADATA